jgi:hypothetical protein
MSKFNLIRKEDGYSIYDNPDKELVEKIKNFPKPNVINHWELGICKIKEKVDDTKVLLVNKNGDLKSMTNEKYAEALHDWHLHEINRVYLVSDTFNKYFAPYHLQNITILKMISKFPIRGLIGIESDSSIKSFYDGVDVIFNEERYSFYISKYNDHFKEIVYEYIEVNYSNHYGMGHMYFTEDGLIKNRDYNMDFNRILNRENIDYNSKEECIEQFLKFFNQFENLKYYKNTWYSLRYCLKYEETRDGFKIVLIPTSGITTYKKRGYKEKIPKTAESVDTEHLVNAMKIFIENLFYKKDETNE